MVQKLNEPSPQQRFPHRTDYQGKVISYSWPFSLLTQPNPKHACKTLLLKNCPPRSDGLSCPLQLDADDEDGAVVAALVGRTMKEAILEVALEEQAEEERISRLTSEALSSFKVSVRWGGI